MGAIITLVFIVFLAIIDVKTILLKNKMAKHVESARKVFTNPTDTELEKNFHNECGKFIIPYLHFRSLSNIGFSSYLKNSDTPSKIYQKISTFIMNFLLSYLLFVFLVSNQAFFKSIIESLSPTLAYFSPLTSIPIIVYQYILPVTFIVFFFCTYRSVQLYKEITGFPGGIPEIICDYFSIFLRVAYVGTNILSAPWSIREHFRSIRYPLFTFQPRTTIEIIKQAVENVEHTQCQVTVWQYEVKNMADVARLKNLIVKRTEIPIFMRSFIVRASDETILKTLNETKPLLYLGIIDSRCAVVGRVMRDEKKRIYKANFSFDNRYVKDMFKSIADIQIETQKKLSSKIPYKLAEIVEKMEGPGGD